MEKIEYAYIKVTNSGPSGAKVQMSIEKNGLDDHKIIINTEKIPFRSQGCIEGGHHNWNLSAEAALLVAVKNLPLPSYYDIVTNKLEGRMFLDTNNAAIGLACILCLCKFLDIQLDSKYISKMDKLLIENWKQDIEIIPDFQSVFD